MERFYSSLHFQDKTCYIWHYYNYYHFMLNSLQPIIVKSHTMERMIIIRSAISFLHQMT